MFDFTDTLAVQAKAWNALAGAWAFILSLYLPLLLMNSIRIRVRDIKDYGVRAGEPIQTVLYSLAYSRGYILFFVLYLLTTSIFYALCVYSCRIIFHVSHAFTIFEWLSCTLLLSSVLEFLKDYAAFYTSLKGYDTYNQNCRLCSIFTPRNNTQRPSSIFPPSPTDALTTAHTPTLSNTPPPRTTHHNNATTDDNPTTTQNCAPPTNDAPAPQNPAPHETHSPTLHKTPPTTTPTNPPFLVFSP